jgi:formylglycine-generating enzyme required for sulfatase activity
MLGNVWELTRSVDAGGRHAVIKGGSFLCNARFCNSARPAARQWQDVEASAAHVGFRLARAGCR